MPHLLPATSADVRILVGLIIGPMFLAAVFGLLFWPRRAGEPPEDDPPEPPVEPAPPGWPRVTGERSRALGHPG